MTRRNWSKRRKQLWLSLLASVPLLALMWSITTHFLNMKSPVTPEVRFLFIAGDDLVDMIGRDTQRKFFADLPLPKPLLIENGLYTELTGAFFAQSLRTNGRTIDSAVFLAVTNVGSEQAAALHFDGSQPVQDYKHLAKGETALLCIQLNFLDGTKRVLHVSTVSLTANNGKTNGVQPGDLPDKSAMAKVPGSRDNVFLGYPK